MARILAVLLVGLIWAGNSFAAVESLSWGAVKTQMTELAGPNAKLVVTANKVAGEREELIFRGRTDWRYYPEQHPSDIVIRRFDIYHPFAGDMVVGLGLDLPAGKYRAFTFRYRTARGRTITGRSLPLPSTLDAYGQLYVMFEWRKAVVEIEEDLSAIGVADPGYLEIYGIR